MSDYNNDNGGGGDNAPVNRGLINDWKTKLFADPIQGGRRQPNMSFRTYKNQVQITVRPNTEARSDEKIEAALEPLDFFAFLENVRGVAQGILEPTPFKLFRPDFQKKNGGQPVPAGTLIVGKREDGAIFIALIGGRDNAIVQFPFLPSKWAQLIDADRNPASAFAVSRNYALSWCNLLGRLISDELKEKFAPPPPRDNNRGGGGNYNRGGGGGGYQNRGNQGGGGYQNRNNQGGNQNGGYQGSHGGGGQGGDSGGSSGGSDLDNFTF